jgi:ribosome-binding factor A
MRRVPRLKFVLDQSIKKEGQVLGAIQDAMEREDETAAPRNEEHEA